MSEEKPSVYGAIIAATEQLKSGKIKPEFSEYVFTQYINNLRLLFIKKYNIEPKEICFNTDYLVDKKLFELIEICGMKVKTTTSYKYDEISLFTSGFPTKESFWNIGKSKILVVQGDKFFTL